MARNSTTPDLAEAAVAENASEDRFLLRIYRGPEESGESVSQQDLAVNEKSVAVAIPSAPPAEVALVPAATEEYLAYLKQQSEALESATPAEIIRWAVKEYAPKLTMATAFGPEGMAIIHMLAAIDRTVPVFNLDTGYQFQETLDLRTRVLEKYGIDIELRKPETSVAEYEKLHNGPLYKSNPDQCCFDRKLKVLQRSALGMSAWMSGIRRDQSPDRARAPIVGWDKKFGLVKVSPLANWTKKEVWSLITKEDVPYNPLHDQGYTSIGCQPCTRAVLFGEDERAGRWSGFEKKECGLHTSND
ncbi:MAG: phosphoadenylyl-sulfate reductase [Planctomycetia bacterium]|nr:phosphoadenylyl-sulfate reductase [Planctomycetia bacterium]